MNESTTQVKHHPSSVSALIRDQLVFQKRWQTISMSSYVSSTIGTLVCTSSSAVLAAESYTHYAAILAAISTVLIGLEKSMLFREKWKFHLLMHTRLKLLEADLSVNAIDEVDAGKRLSEILQSYAMDLPVSSREA